MTKKKRHHPDVEEILSRPWCYYCERDFDDLKILISHQKAKHFKCERCGRRLNTAGGLSVHMSQVHKETLTAVDNALPNRAGLDIEIFAMEGIPEEIVQQHNQRVLTQYHTQLAERQALSGHSAGGNNTNKKPKLESTSDLKKRLAEHKAAKLAAEQSAGGGSGDSTPVGAGQNPYSTTNSTAAQSPSYNQFQQGYAPSPTAGFVQNSYVPPGNSSYQPPNYGQAGSPVQPGYTQLPTPVTTYGQPQSATPVYGQPQPTVPTYGQSQTFGQPQNYGQPYQHPAGTYPPQPAFSPPPFQNQHYPHNPLPYPSQNGNRSHRAGSPIPPFPQQNLPQRTISPGQNGFPAPARTGSVTLSAAPSLPQRPAFAAPSVNAFQFQQMHQGQIPQPQTHNLQNQAKDNSSVVYNPAQPQTVTPGQHKEDYTSASIDDLISSASKQADEKAAATQTDTANETGPILEKTEVPTVSVPAKEEVPPAVDEKTSKKEKDKDKDKEKNKATRLVYSDNDTSPEEKMALLAKYRFIPVAG